MLPREIIIGCSITGEFLVTHCIQRSNFAMSKKLSLLSLILVVFVIFAVAVPLTAQEEQRWDGADDLEVNPLDCPGEEAAAEPEATEETMAEVPEYDGGQPTDAPDKAGQPIVLVDIPKLIGIGYWQCDGHD
jgi:hypothetical protein